MSYHEDDTFGFSQFNQFQTLLIFERQGFFCADRVDCKPGRLVFNRSVTLKDSWATAKQL